MVADHRYVSFTVRYVAICKLIFPFTEHDAQKDLCGNVKFPVKFTGSM